LRPQEACCRRKERELPEPMIKKYAMAEK
jgi:hypothetical protein